MFGDLTFAGGTFSDFFTVAGQISYTFRKGRTMVVAIIPENGTIITDVPPRFVRSKVDAIKTISTNPQTGL
jgi:hypothetical protein